MEAWLIEQYGRGGVADKTLVGRGGVVDTTLVGRGGVVDVSRTWWRWG